MRRFARAVTSACLAAAILCSLDLHLPLLQVVAWSGMIVKYARTGDARTALRETFDGDHPCRLCCAIRAARHRPAQTISGAPNSRSDLIAVESRSVLPDPPRGLWALATDAVMLEPARLPPPVPPPRA